MKLPIIGLFMLLLLLLFTSSVAAGLEITEGKAVLNVNYNDFADDDQKTIRSTGEFTIKNTGTTTASVRVSYSGLPAEYKPVDLGVIEVPANNGIKAVTFSLDVPHREDSGEKTIGTMTITTTATPAEAVSVPLVQKTKPMIEFRELTVEYTDRKGTAQKEDFNAPDNFELENGVRPGTEVKLILEIKNLFNDDYKENGDLEDLTLNIEADDDDLFTSDFKDELDLGTLEGSKKKEYTVTFLVSEDADAQDYRLDLTLEADDGENAHQEVKRELKLEVARDRNDIRIKTIKVLPDTITTCENQFSLEVELKNYGIRDHQFAGLSIFNQGLGVNKNVQNINLGEYNDRESVWKDTFSFPVPEETGTYPVDVTAYFDKDKIADHERVDVSISRCTTPPEESTTPSTSTPPAQTTPTPTAPPPEQPRQTTTTVPTQTQPAATAPVAPPSASASQDYTGEIIKTVENPYTFEDFLVALVIAAFVFVVALIIIFIIVLFK